MYHIYNLYIKQNFVNLKQKNAYLLSRDALHHVRAPTEVGASLERRRYNTYTFLQHMNSLLQYINPMYILAVLIALSVHECCHALAAYWLGDDTAKEQGRLTLNPIAHLDLIGTLLFFIAGFGWAKPVPIDPSYFKNPRRGTAMTALAGPLSNLLIAFTCFIILLVIGLRATGVMSLLSVPSAGQTASLLLLQFLRASLFVNIGLFAFNLLPIAPLDGSKVMGVFVPLRHEDAYNTWLARGPFVLLGLIIAEQVLHVPIISFWVFTIAEWTMRLFLLLS